MTLERRNYNKNKLRLMTILGNKCSICKTSENLEFDHIDPKTKSLVITEYLTNGNIPEKVYDELNLIQLLCHKHHKDKSLLEANKKRLVHGTRACYVHLRCRCSACKEADKSYKYLYHMRTGKW